MSARSSSLSGAVARSLACVALLCAFAGCGDDDSKSDPKSSSDEGTKSGSATDKPADPAVDKGDDGEADDEEAPAAAQPGSGLERPGTLARPPSDGKVPADLRPPR